MRSGTCVMGHQLAEVGVLYLRNLHQWLTAMATSIISCKLVSGDVFTFG